MKRVKIETERPHLFDTSILIAMRIHVKGSVSETVLRDAFQKAVSAHEILSMKVTLLENGEAYYEENGKGNQIYFETISWRSILKREEKKRFKIDEGEFLKCFCYEIDEQGCKLLFLMHHLGGDGKSLVYFIESFMKALSGEELEFNEIRTIPAGDMDEKSLRDRLGPYSFFPKSYNGKWEKDKDRKTFTFEDLDAAHENYWTDRESDVKEYVIKPKIVSRIMDRCHEWNVGFTAYITTCFMRRFGRKLDVGYAIDAREDGNRCMGNQASGISLKYAYNYNKSFEKNVKKVQKLLDNKLEDDQARGVLLAFIAAIEPTLLDAANFEHAGTFHSKTSKSFAKTMGYGKKTKDLSITNLTKLDIPDTYGELKISYFSFIPPVVSNGKNIIGLSTLGENTVLVVHRLKI